MSKNILKIEKNSKKFANTTTIPKSLINLKLTFGGQFLDITESYYWFFNFAYYNGKGYKTLKLEDHHYFSENSQFGGQIRQVKGGTIRAFQETFNQLIQLIKIHLFPLLKELKQAEFYNQWISQIVDYDKVYQEELKKSKNKINYENLKKFKNQRDEAINHLKDKWVMEVDGGRLWQMNRSSTEQGLDYALLPQLFFGTNLENPLQQLHKKGKTIKEQLDDDIYSIDISEGAKEQTARFMFRFYTWLPTAIKETQTTFKLKISALKQFYAQIQMHINFLKPLLIEINKKNEGVEKTSFYKGFESENHEIVNLFDCSYSLIRTLGIRGLEREGFKIQDLEFTDFGLFIQSKTSSSKNVILKGKMRGKSGFILKQTNVCQTCLKECSNKCKTCQNSTIKPQFEFYETKNKNITHQEFEKLKKTYINIDDLFEFPIIELIFSQKRRNEIQNSQQGLQQIPFMRNQILFNGYTWNLFQIASYREKLKEDDLELLSTFIEEMAIMKEDLLHYLKGPTINKVDIQEDNKSKKDIIKNSENDVFFGPIVGIYNIFKPLVPSFNFIKNKKEEDLGEHNLQKTAKLNVLEDTWKIYTVYKKSHGYIQY